MQCEVAVITEVHPNVAGGGKAPSIKDACLCVSNLPMATEATWLHAEQCEVGGHRVLPLCLPAVLPQTVDGAF